MMFRNRPRRGATTSVAAPAVPIAEPYVAAVGDSRIQGFEIRPERRVGTAAYIGCHEAQADQYAVYELRDVVAGESLQAYAPCEFEVISGRIRRCVAVRVDRTSAEYAVAELMAS